jgi:hypothetical protein
MCTIRSSSAFTLATALAVALAAASLVAQTHSTIGLTFATSETGSPVSILSSTATQSFMFQAVQVKNTSQETIATVTFGVMIYPVQASSKAKPVFISGYAIGASLGPGQEATLNVSLLPAATALARASTFGTAPVQAQLGVSAVRFSDGSAWTFDAKSRGGFEPQSHVAPRVQQLSSRAPCAQHLFATFRLVSNQSPNTYFTCQPGGQPVYCENHYSYCTMQVCTILNECPDQVCQYHQ